MRSQEIELIGELEQVDEAVAHKIAGVLVPRRVEEDHLGDHLVAAQLIARLFGLHQGGQDVVSWTCSLRLDDRLDVADHRAARLDRGGLLSGRVERIDGLGHRFGPPPKPAGVTGRHPEHLRDDLVREDRGELVDHVDRVTLLEVRQQTIDHQFGALPPGGDRPRGEGLGHQVTEPRVVVAVASQHHPVGHAATRDVTGPLGIEDRGRQRMVDPDGQRPVPSEAVDVGVAGEDVRAGQPVEVHRLVLPELRVLVVRVREVAGSEGIEGDRDRPAGGRPARVRRSGRPLIAAGGAGEPGGSDVELVGDSEPDRQLAKEREGDIRAFGEELEEPGAVHLLDDHVGARGDRGMPGLAVEEGELTDRLTRADGGHVETADGDLGGALDDDPPPVGDLPLEAEDRTLGDLTGAGDRRR